MEKQKNELEKSLLSLGLSEKESAVYLALLELGRAKVSEISRKAGMNRTTGYDILDALVSKGLVRISGKEPKQEYATESPDKLLLLLNTELEEKQKNIQKAKELVPQLKSMQKMQDRPQVKFYEGKDGLKQVYEDTLTSTEIIRAYATVEDMHAALGSYFPAYYKRRTGKGIAIRTIMPNTPSSVERASHDKEEARESALIPAEKFTFHPEINIYNNKVMIASWREKLGIIIESAEIADAMKKIFELAWAEAKRLDALSRNAPV